VRRRAGGGAAAGSDSPGGGGGGGLGGGGSSNSLTTPPDASALATPPLTGENFNLRSVLLKTHAPGVLAVKYARAKKLLSLPSDAPLLRAVEIFATGIHRLSVVDARGGALLGVLSQSVAVRYLWSKAGALRPFFERTVRSLGLGVAPVVSVGDGQTVISALATMHRDRLSSVAILDRTGGILGTLSLTDIKVRYSGGRAAGMQPSAMAVLAWPERVVLLCAAAVLCLGGAH